MSGSGSFSSYLGVEDPQWLCMLTLFVASLVTLTLHFAQYLQHWLVGNKPPPAAAQEGEEGEEEAAALLGWALSLKSWKAQWRTVWCRALNDKSREREVSLMTASTTAVRQVTSIKPPHWGSTMWNQQGSLKNTPQPSTCIRINMLQLRQFTIAQTVDFSNLYYGDIISL